MARAKLAFDIYVHRLQSGIGAMIAVLGGVDAVVFTRGRRRKLTRSSRRRVRQFRVPGPAARPGKERPIAIGQNDKDKDISAPDATVRVLVIHAQEDWMIARSAGISRARLQHA